MHALAQILLHQTPRERMLLVLLVLIVLPFAYVMFIFLPLQDQRAAQIAQQAQARTLLDWLTETARTYVPPPISDDAANPSAENGAAAPITGLADLERSLTNAGLRPAVTQLSMQDQGATGGQRRSRITLGFDAVAFVPAMGWLSDLAARGVQIRDIRLEHLNDAPGQVRLDLLLETQI